MLLYRLRERWIRFQPAPGARLIFPNLATINLVFAPSVAFGGVPGVSRTAIPGGQFVLNHNFSTGRVGNHLQTPMFDPLDAFIENESVKFQIKGNQATVQFHCPALENLVEVISTVFYVFPAILNVYFPDVPLPSRISGRVGDVPFRWLFEPSELISEITITTKTNQENLVTESWARVPMVAPNVRLFGGLFYFHAACRLLQVGGNRFEFLSEAILNFSKSLQAAFGEKRDAVRKELRRLGYNDQEIEGKFLSAIVLRDAFDVAHASRANLDRDQLRTLHQYADLAENAFRQLFKELLSKVERGEYTAPVAKPHPISRDQKRILRRLAENIRSFVPRDADNTSSPAREKSTGTENQAVDVDAAENKEQKLYVGSTVQIDNGTYTECTFKDCTLEFSGEGPVSFVGCTFEHVNWVFSGAAELTLDLLKALYHGMGDGGRSLVEATFENIRKTVYPRA